MLPSHSCRLFSEKRRKQTMSSGKTFLFPRSRQKFCCELVPQSTSLSHWLKEDALLTNFDTQILECYCNREIINNSNIHLRCFRTTHIIALQGNKRSDKCLSYIMKPRTMISPPVVATSPAFHLLHQYQSMPFGLGQSYDDMGCKILRAVAIVNIPCIFRR